jgi:hypothetical protein
MTSRFAVLLLLPMIAASPAPAQDARPARVPTIEELYLTNPWVMSVREEALSYDADVKMQALSDIDKRMGEGKLRGDDEQSVQAILIGLAGEGTYYAVSEDRRLVNYYPTVRRKAAELLGRLGSQTSDPVVRDRAIFRLLDILSFDDEVMVKAEAVYGLGVIGNNDEGVVTEVIADSIRRQSSVAPDNNYAYATALAIEKLADKSQDMRDFRAYTALVTIMQGNYTRKVKDKALEVLQKIRGY